jgi:hypothetical protein
MIEIAAKEVIFHFNKKSLVDASVPAWCLKMQGKTWYVNHVTCELPWSTKETPQGTTQGAIKIKRALVQIDDLNQATIIKLTREHEQRAKEREQEAIIVGWTNAVWSAHMDQVRHSEIHLLESGGCSSDWWACELYSEEDWAAINLQLYPHVRRFMPNEWQFKDYQSGLGEPVSDAESTH